MSRRRERKDDSKNDGDEDDYKRDSKSDRSVTKKSRGGNQNDSNRRTLKWFGFAKPKFVLGFDHLTPTDVPAMTGKPRGLAITFESITGWKFPSVVDDSEDFEFTIALSFSLFHLSTGTFFGSTWMSDQLYPTENANERSSGNFDCKDIVYMITRITDPSCFGIVEVVVSKTHKVSKLLKAQYGCGWTFINLFSGSPPDVMEGFGAEFTTNATFFEGSPRDLIHCNSSAKLKDVLKEIPGCELHFKILSHKRLLRAQRLLGENEVVGRFDIIPGLLPKEVVPSNETQTKSLPCIGEDEKIDPKLGTYIVPANPNVALPMLVKIGNCNIDCPGRIDMERRMCEQIASNLHTQAEPKIVSRILKACLHNGHTVLGSDWQSGDLEEIRDDVDLLHLRGILELQGYLPHDLMCIAFMLEYEIGVTLAADSHVNTKTILDTRMRHGKLVTTLCLGTGTFIPCNGKNVFLYASNSMNNPDSETTKLEVNIRTDDVCHLLSAKPMFRDLGEDGIPLGAKLRQLSQNRKLASSAAEKKTASTVRNSRNTALKDKDKDSDGSDLGINDASCTGIVMSCELTVLDSANVEISHGDEIPSGSDNDAAADKELSTTRGRRNRRDLLDDEEDTRPKSRRSRSPDKAAASKDQDNHRTIVSPRYDRIPRDDDTASVSESLVTGDSETSALNLDSRFYAYNYDGHGSKLSKHISEAMAIPSDAFAADAPFSAPRNQSSLYAQALLTKLKSVTSRKQPSGIADDTAYELLDTPMQASTATSRIGIAPSAGLSGAHSYVRELTRGARSRLNRHGIDGAIQDDVAMYGHRPGQSKMIAGEGPKDIELEARDTLNVHDISIQFVGYRSGSKKHSTGDLDLGMTNVPRPHSVYFSFQFYTCLATRTEVMRLLPSENGQISVLVRDEANAKDEAPLALRYTIDCSSVSPTEAIEFAEYLSSCQLFVDVWDADSLLLLGTCCIPLRRLMRQGQSIAKCAIETDVINADLADISSGGVTSSSIVHGAPVGGTVIGSVQMVVCNYGQVGKGNISKVNSSKAKDAATAIGDGLNWRANGAMRASDVPTKVSKRPKNSVRARPLSECSPELSKALTDFRGSSDGLRGSMRSLGAGRGDETSHTLTYDDILVLFKKFQGTVRGTVQYVGDLMKLLDVPSIALSIRKLIRVFLAIEENGPGEFEKEITKFAESGGHLSLNNLREFFRTVFDRFGIPHRSEELMLLAHKFVSSDKDETTAKDVSRFCREEADRQDWALVSRRLRSAGQKASIVGSDLDAMISEYDTNGDHFISMVDFRSFLRDLGQYGKISGKDIATASRRFAEAHRPERGSDRRDPISLADVMSFFGKAYVGNLESRLRRSIINSIADAANAGASKQEEKLSGVASGLDPQTGALHLQQALLALDKDKTGELRLSDFESIFQSWSVYTDLAHEQVKKILSKLDTAGRGKLFIAQFVKFIFGNDVVVSDLCGKKSKDEQQPLNAEALLRLLLERVQKHVAVDEAFRHFDTNGDGVISQAELEKGLDDLGIFDNVPNWKKELPSIVAKFDTSGDGNVSLAEFLKYLGVDDYSPNIIQRMTKLFALASERLSIGDIFKEYDTDGGGYVDAKELRAGIIRMNLYPDITQADSEAVIAKFDTDGDGKITMREFVDFFSQRIKQAQLERKKKRNQLLAKRFRDLVHAMVAKGGSVEQLFAHFDKDGGGFISPQELSSGLRSISHFKSLTDQEIEGLVDILDADKNGDISLEELKEFIGVAASTEAEKKAFHKYVSKRCDNLRKIINVAIQKNGLTLEKIFSYADTDKSGELSVEELKVLLNRFNSFKDIPKEEVEEMLRELDADGSGLISKSEFKMFLEHSPQETAQPGGVVAQSTKEQRQGDTGKVAPKKQAGTPREIFTRHMLRISQSDGGIEGLLAYLDDDEDGLIQASNITRLLRREGVFDDVDEGDIRKILSQYEKGDEGQISVVLLLRYLEGRDGTQIPLAAVDDEEDLKLIADEYAFSSDLETRTLEKKIRQVGRSLARKGIDIESIFKSFDMRDSGMIRRTEFIEALTRIGLYVLEKGKVLDASADDGENGDIKRLQQAQISRLKGHAVSDSRNRQARKLVMNAGEESKTDFMDHLQSMSLINSYRQTQKRHMLQRVLSHSLASTIHLYPRFGKTLFFEHPISNPFGHEERFIVDIRSDESELKLVTSLDEWIQLRSSCRPCAGELGDDPVEAEMFDTDGYGNVQVALLPQETLHLPFTFMTLLPTIASTSSPAVKSIRRVRSSKDESKDADADDDEEPMRTVEIKIISGTHGHVISVLYIHVHPRPFAVNRTLRFFEPENTIMKRRVQLMGYTASNRRSRETPASLFFHCVECDDRSRSMGNAGDKVQSKVVIEWTQSRNAVGGEALDMIIRYRVMSFPTVGSFYLLLYDDSYQIQLKEVWHVIIQSRQKLDLHGHVGSTSQVDLVIRGDRFARRARAYASLCSDSVYFQPNNYFQLVPGAYNRVLTGYNFKRIGLKKLQINIVDVDSRELISAWILGTTATAPSAMRTYDVCLMPGVPTLKKIVFKNPWDIPRKFTLTSSNESLMKPRSLTLDVTGHGNAYLRLWFCGIEAGQQLTDVYLFLNDEQGQSEECFLFQLSEGRPSAY